MTDRSLTDLDPELQAKVPQCIAAYGRKVTITETFRDPTREDMLHAQHITAATGRTCQHCVMIDGKPASRAFDFALYNDKGDYIADGTHSYYVEFGQIAKNEGLKWGGDFTHPDYDHVELPILTT